MRRLPAPVARAADLALEMTVVGSFSHLGYAARRALFGWDDTPPGQMQDRVVAITGASGGIGLAAANLLAGRGAHVLLMGRNPLRIERARQSILDSCPTAHLDTVIVDLASLDAVRRAAGLVSGLVPQVDALIHNAGALVRERLMTSDGLELTAQVHVVAPFLLTAALVPLLQSSNDARVVFVSSAGMYTRRLDVDELELPADPFNGVRVYANAKRAQIVLVGLWSRLPSTGGISFHAMHPGWADTPGVQVSLPMFRRVMRPILRSAAEGADTIAWLSGAPEAREMHGEFWLDRRPRATTILPWTRTPKDQARKLWDLCVARSGAGLGVAP